MKTLIVTGGIATGKSTFIRLLMEEGGARLRLFDCDAEAGRLLDGGTLKAPLSSVFGPASVDSSGKADRHFLRELVFRNPEPPPDGFNFAVCVTEQGIISRSAAQKNGFLCGVKTR